MIKKILKKLIYGSWSKWHPISTYTNCDNTYYIQGSINLKTGEIKFKSVLLCESIVESGIDLKSELKWLMDNPIEI